MMTACHCEQRRTAEPEPVRLFVACCCHLLGKICSAVQSDCLKVEKKNSINSSAGKFCLEQAACEIIQKFLANTVFGANTENNQLIQFRSTAICASPRVSLLSPSPGFNCFCQQQYALISHNICLQQFCVRAIFWPTKRERRLRKVVPTELESHSDGGEVLSSPPRMNRPARSRRQVAIKEILPFGRR